MPNFESHTLLWKPGTNSPAGIILGNAMTTLGGCTVTTPNPSNGSVRQSLPRTNFEASASPGKAGVITTNAIGRLGASTSADGFAFHARFALAANRTTSRAFVGVSASNAASALVDNGAGVAAVADSLGIAFDDDAGATVPMASGNWYLYARDNAGNHHALDLGLARNTTSVLDLLMVAPPSGGPVLFALYDLTNKRLVTCDSVTTNLPTPTVMLYAHVENAATNAGAHATLELMSLDVRRAHDGVFDVRDFGAVGDGATDDSSALNAALWYASRFQTVGQTAAAGARVVVPPGDYFCASPVHLIGPSCVEGPSGGADAPAILRFDQDVGAPSDPTADDTDDGCVVLHAAGTSPIPTRVRAQAYDVGDLIVPVDGVWAGLYYRVIATTGDRKTSGATDDPGFLTNPLANFGVPITDGNVTLALWGALDGASGAIVRRLVLTQVPGGDLSKTCSGVRMHAAGRLEDLHIQGFQGDGIHIRGAAVAGHPKLSTNANLWSMSGKVSVHDCGRYGMKIYGPDSNAGHVEGILDLTGNQSYGLWSKAPLGNLYGQIHTHGNGLVIDGGVWKHNEVVVTPDPAWPGTDTPVVLGQLCLPAPANRTGFQYRCTRAGRTNLFAEPNWAAHTDLDEPYFVDGTAHWTCFMEEGGSIRTVTGTGAINVFERVYAEMNQQPASIGTDVLLGSNAELVMTKDSTPLLGMAKGFFLPHSVVSRTQEASPALVMQIDIGNLSDQNLGLRFRLAPSPEGFTPGGAVPDAHDLVFKRTVGDPFGDYGQRWVMQAGTGAGSGVSYTQCQSIQLPESGAMCFPKLFLGSQIRHERRVTTAFVAADTPRGSRPDTTNMVSAFGAYRPGDVLLNNYVDNDGWADDPSAKWPVLWRPDTFGGVTTSGRSDDYPYRVGDVVYVGDYAYRAETAGLSGHDPAVASWFAATTGRGDLLHDATPVDKMDGDIEWRNVGVKTADLPFVPLLVERPTMATVTTAGLATKTLDADESAYARFKLVGADQDVTVNLQPGPANGWVRAFWNANTVAGGNYTVTVGIAGGGLTVPIAAESLAMIFSDGNDCFQL